MNYGDHN